MRATGRLAAMLAVTVAMSGCAGAGGLGGLGEVLGTVLGGGQGQGQLLVEVQQVDTRQQSIHVRTQDGRTGAVRYDANTQVIYQNQQYPVTALERGDIANLELQQLQNNVLYVSRVLVQQSVQERTGQAQPGAPGTATGEVYQFSGRVGNVNPQGGLFELETANGTVTVTMSASASAADVQRFNALRPGQTISLQGRYVASAMIELHRFL